MKALIGLALIATLLVSACATGRFTAARQIVSARETLIQASPCNNAKALFEPHTGTLFVMQRETHEIHIYRDNARINSIGGLGFERINFQRLSDMALDSEGNLLVLDSLYRRVKKFSPDGKYISELALPEAQQPELLCPGGEQNLFIYDSAPQEIICYSLFDGAVLYRFGRFQLARLSSISCGRDYLSAFSAADNLSHIYYNLGQFKESVAGQVIFDSFNNPVVLEKLADTATFGSLLRYASAEDPIPMMQPSGAMSLYRGFVTLPYENEARVYQLLYDRVAQ